MKLSKSSYYDSIHNCTIYAFDECLKTGELKHIHLSGEFNEELAYKNWCKIFDEYIKEGYFPNTYKDYLKEMIKVCNLYNKAIKGERHLITMARIKEAQAKQLIAGEGEPISKTVARMSKFMGMLISPKSITVAQFYSNISLMNNG